MPLFLNDALFYENTFEYFDRLVNLFLGVCSHEGISYQSVLWCTCWRHNWIDEDTSLVCECCDEESLLNVAYVEWDDRRLSLANLKTFILESFESVVCYVPQVLDAFRFTFYDVECSLSGSRSCWSV